MSAAGTLRARTANSCAPKLVLVHVSLCAQISNAHSTLAARNACRVILLRDASTWHSHAARRLPHVMRMLTTACKNTPYYMDPSPVPETYMLCPCMDINRKVAGKGPTHYPKAGDWQVTLGRPRTFVFFFCWQYKLRPQLTYPRAFQPVPRTKGVTSSHAVGLITPIPCLALTICWRMCRAASTS